jgi:hypothetical protein
MMKLRPLVVKHSYDRFTVQLSYASKLPAGVLLSSLAATATNLKTGADVTATIIASATVVSSLVAGIRCQAGATETRYRVSVLATLSNTDIVQDEFTLVVNDTARAYLVKNPSEELTVSVDYNSRIATGASVSTATAVATDTSDGSDAAAILVSPLVVTANVVKLKVIEGTLGRRYRIGVRAALSNGDQLQDDFHIQVSP